MPEIPVAVQVVEAQVEIVVETPQRSYAEAPNRFNSSSRYFLFTFLLTSSAIFIIYSNLGTRN